MSNRLSSLILDYPSTFPASYPSLLNETVRGAVSVLESSDVSVQESSELDIKDWTNKKVKNKKLGSKSRDKKYKPMYIILHFSSAILVKKVTKPCDPEEILKAWVDDGVSAHYLIARDGTVYKVVDEKKIAYHAGKGKGKNAKKPRFPRGPKKNNESTNTYSIGIEMAAIGSQTDMKIFKAFKKEGKYNELVTTKHADLVGYKDAQYDSLKKLIDEIIERNPDIKKDRDHILGHEELFEKKEVKPDPGTKFEWTKIGLEDKPKE